MAREGLPKNKKDNSKRRFKGGGPRPDRAEAKRGFDTKREAAWRRLSPQQQLEELDRRLGKGLGAKRQRERLLLLVEKSKLARDETKARRDRR